MIKTAAMAVWAAVLAVGAAAETATTISQFSGKPVPRFESLRYSAVHGRSGPTLDHPILWRYEREGLPVLILKESPGWRRVRDPDGVEVWVAARMLSSAPRVMARRETVLRRRAEDDAPGLARLEAGAIVELREVDGAWAELKAGRRTGWARCEDLWGAALDEAAL